MCNRKFFATAHSSEENGIVERANQEVMRHLRALLFDSRVHDKWSFEQLPLVQRIMNTVDLQLYMEELISIAPIDNHAQLHCFDTV